MNNKRLYNIIKIKNKERKRKTKKMGESFEALGVAEVANTDTHGSSTLKQETKKENP